MQQLMSELTHWHLDLGASPTSHHSTYFKVWAPHHQALSIKIDGKGIFPLRREPDGYFFTQLSGVGIGERYVYVFENGTERPDPVSRYLPLGVHGMTEIVETHDFPWTDEAWRGISWEECVFYEVHVGTFTPQGTFEALIEKLPYLKNLGITCLEIMPVAECPGAFNWGYDGASLYAVAKRYGGPHSFKKLIDACHSLGIAVCLDVVYNHLGPEGNYLGDFGPYFTDHYHSTWGKAFNYDQAYSSFVRDFVIKNALHWLIEYHIDALRIDAIHGIYDFSATPMLSQLKRAVDEIATKTGHTIHLIAESDLNDSRVIRPFREGGWNFSGLWNDDFHHAVHVTFTKENHGYYIDFKGRIDLVHALNNGFVYEGQESIFRKQMHGNSSRGIPHERFVSFTQNHDQVGNRAKGDRLTTHLSSSQLKMAAALTILTPNTPLLFMGEEYGEKHPFEYFVDYKDKKLMESIVEGRKKDFKRDDMPFPGKEAFERSKLSWTIDSHLLDWYRSLLLLRKNYPPAPLLTGELTCVSNEGWLGWEYLATTGHFLSILCNLSSVNKELSFPLLHLTPCTPLLTEGAIEMREEKISLGPYSIGIFISSS